MAHYTLFTDENYELTTSWDETGVKINIRNWDWLQNPTEDLTITLNTFDIETLIEELQLYSAAVEQAAENATKITKSDRQDMLADIVKQTIK